MRTSWLLCSMLNSGSGLPGASKCFPLLLEGLGFCLNMILKCKYSPQLQKNVWIQLWWLLCVWRYFFSFYCEFFLKYVIKIIVAKKGIYMSFYEAYKTKLSILISVQIIHFALMAYTGLYEDYLVIYVKGCIYLVKILKTIIIFLQ